MPVNKNALLRYKTIDRCLRNPYRQWTLEDLVDACSDALYEMEGITRGVSMRTIQNDIHVMRSDRLGYNAPIEVYDNKYYRYAEPHYSITSLPLTEDDGDLLREALAMLTMPKERRDEAQLESVLSEVAIKIENFLNYV